MKKRPNLLFIFSDQHRANALGCYGSTYINTPNLDQLADTGIRFERCISNTPVCVPARGTLLTGRMPWNHGALTNDLPINPEVESIAQVLTKSGYKTGYIGKWHLGGVPRDQYIPKDKRLGFQEWKVANCTHDYFQSYFDDEDNQRHKIAGHETITQTDLAIDFIQRNSRNETDENPWALFLSFGIPHDPYHLAPKEYLDAYQDLAVELSPNVPKVIHQTQTIIRSRDEIRAWIQGYAALTTFMDHQIGCILTNLRETRNLENTLIVYTSDHGDMLGSQGFTHKQLPFTESVRIPLLISLPGVIPKAATQSLISLVDLPVTILGFLGLEFHNPVDGKDLSNLLNNPQWVGIDACLICDLVPCHQAADRGQDSWVGVCTPTHTYARWANKEPYICFNDRDDPYQLENLIEINPEVTQHLDMKTNKLLAEFGYQFRPWQQMIREDGYLEAWNTSQNYFNRPLLENQ